MQKKTKDGIIIQFKISPNASKNEIVKNNGEIKIKINAQPVDGKANKAVVEFLSKELKIPKSAIEIIKGHAGKEKTILFKVFDEEKIKNIKIYFEI